MVDGGKVPAIFSTGWRLMVSFTLQLLFPQENMYGEMSPK
jgi:hypothetical protein